MVKRVSVFIVVILLINFANPIQYAYADKCAGQNHKLNKEDLEEFIKNTVPTQLKENNIGGFSVTIVKNGEILISQGYGYADISNGLKANSDTMFRIGSVTKLFTWTGIMQLVEQKKINLDDDISKYLGDIKLKGKYKEPIKVKNLMTHTSGIEDKISNLFMSKDEEIPSLKQALLKDKRNRIFKPNEIIAYSNYGAALAGLIIENVSGMAYDEYIKKNILDPLDMNRTTILQPASSEYNNVSKGHIFMKDRYKVFEDPFTQLPPIGAISTSANDIGKFMIMHLQNGRYKDRTILKENTIKSMHKTQFTSDKKLPGICLGFMEWQRNGKRIIWHSGGTALFKTLLMLIPDENIGVFISYNSPNSEKARNEFRQAFLDRYFPYNLEKVNPLKNYKKRVKKYEGYFKEGRTAKYNSDKLIYALSRVEKVTSNNDGTLTFRGTRYIEIEPLVFHEVNGQGKLIFHEDRNKNIKYAFQDFEPHEAYIKINWYENGLFSVMLLTLFIIFFLSILIAKFLKNILSNKKQNKVGNMKIEKLIQLICIIQLLFPIGAILGFGIDIMYNPRIITTGSIPLMFRISLIFPVIAGCITIRTILYVIRNWQCKDLKVRSKIYYLVVIIISLLFIVWMYYWNLLGYFR